MAVLFPSVVASSGYDVDAELSFSRAQVWGGHSITAQPFAAFVEHTGQAPATVVLHGTTVDVNMTTVDQYQVTSSTPQGNRSLGRISVGPPHYSQFRLQDASFALRDETGRPQFLFMASGAMALDGRSDHTQEFVSAGETWRAGSLPNAWQISGNSPASSAYRVQPNQLEALQNGSAVHLGGDFTLGIWNLTLTTSTPAGEQELRSGSWSADEGPPSAAPGGLIHGIRTQLVRLQFTNGSAAFDGPGLEARTVATRFVLDGRGSLEIPDPRGDMRIGGEESRIDSSVAIVGTLDLDAHRDVGSSRIVGLIHAGDATIQGGASELARPAPESRTLANGPVSAGWLTLLALPVVALALGAWLFARRGAPTAAEVEELLKAGQAAAAAKLARRALRRSPEDANLLFLLGASLFQSGALDAIVREVEPCVAALAPKDRAPLALLLSLAHAHLQNRHRAERWAAEAAQDPGYSIDLDDGIRPSAIIPGYA